jgi:phage gp46-like protein
MKSFIATLLAAGAMAAIEEKKWTGTKVTGEYDCTPSASSSYDGTKTDITVTYKTTATLSAKMAKGKKCQVWWCDVESTSSTHCHLWQFEQGEKDAENVIKGRVYAGASVPNVTADKNAKDWF